MARTGGKSADKPTLKEAEERIENGLALPRRPDRRALPGGDRHQRGSFRLHVILGAAARAAGAAVEVLETINVFCRPAWSSRRGQKGAE